MGYCYLIITEKYSHFYKKNKQSDKNIIKIGKTDK